VFGKSGVVHSWFFVWLNLMIIHLWVKESSVMEYTTSIMKMERASYQETPVTSLIEVVSYFRTLNSSYCSENFKSHVFGLYSWPETVVSAERMLDS
jgi:hypothetical protein